MHAEQSVQVQCDAEQSVAQVQCDLSECLYIVKPMHGADEQFTIRRIILYTVVISATVWLLPVCVLPA